MPELPVDILRRLAFAKYIFHLGLLESKKRSPLNAASLLMFHDAAELFLQIASEHLDVGKAQPTFVEYWDLLSSRAARPVTQKERMRRLNKARVALKHHGTTPSSEDVIAFRETAARFFEENTPVLFDLQFRQLTLVEFVEPPAARERLGRAVAAILDERVTEAALTDTAIAFEAIIARREHEISPGPFPVFPFGTVFAMSPFAFRFDHDTDRSVIQSISAITGAIAEIQRVEKMLIMGVDFSGWLRFQSHLPNIVEMANGDYQSTFSQPADTMADVEDLEFCVQYAVETALTLQQGIKPWSE